MCTADTLSNIDRYLNMDRIVRSVPDAGPHTSTGKWTRT